MLLGTLFSDYPLLIITATTVSLVLLQLVASNVYAFKQRMAEIPYQNTFARILAAIIKNKLTPGIISYGNLSAEDRAYIQQNPIIVVANHQFSPDPAFMAIALNKPLAFLATDAFNKIPLVKKILNAFNCILVPVKSGARAAIVSQSIEKLNNDQSIGIFPYGCFHTYLSTSKNITIRGGAAEIAIRSQKPIIILDINNVEQKVIGTIWEALKYYLRHGSDSISINIKKIIKPEDFPTATALEQQILLLTIILQKEISNQYHISPNGNQFLATKDLTMPDQIKPSLNRPAGVIFQFKALLSQPQALTDAEHRIIQQDYDRLSASRRCDSTGNYFAVVPYKKHSMIP